MFTDLSPAALKDIISAVEPIDLKGVALLRRCHPSPILPAGIDPADLAEAAVEIIDYTRACEASLRRLKGLRPIPVTAIAIEEFSL